MDNLYVLRINSNSRNTIWCDRIHKRIFRTRFKRVHIYKIVVPKLWIFIGIAHFFWFRFFICKFHRYPAGVNPAACPNYPYCDTTLGASHHAAVAAPLPGYTQRQYPAHFNPGSLWNAPHQTFQLKLNAFFFSLFSLSVEYPWDIYRMQHNQLHVQTSHTATTTQVVQSTTKRWIKSS